MIPVEKTALIADTTLDSLPGDFALLVRRCVILHWFDQSIIETLKQDILLVQSKTDDLYERIRVLPLSVRSSWLCPG